MARELKQQGLWPEQQEDQGPGKLKPCLPFLLSPAHPDEWPGFSRGTQISGTLKTQSVGQSCLARVLGHLAKHSIHAHVLNVTKHTAVGRSRT